MNEKKGVRNRFWTRIAANLSIEPNDFEYAPFSQQGGLGKAHRLFTNKLGVIIDELNQKLVA